MQDFDAVSDARTYFPRGLRQPEGGFRFAVDALLLAAFALRRPVPAGGAMLDLGCGCGVVALACLLASPGLTAMGVDILPEQVAAARENAAMLGLVDRFAVKEMDIAVPAERQALGVGGYALLTANMPYREPGSGRLPRDAARQKALFATPSTMPSFLAGARQALAPGGEYVLVYPWDTREILLRSLEEGGFSPVEVLAVRTGSAAHSRCLVRAVHRAASPKTLLCNLPPLDLHQEPGGRFSEEAIAFCPWLAPLSSKEGGNQFG